MTAERFEVFAYSYGADDGKGMRQRLETTFDRFTDIQALSGDDAARAIYRDEVDILIDLKGYTQGTRTAILTFRPAPIQVNYLGISRHSRRRCLRLHRHRRLRHAAGQPRRP